MKSGGTGLADVALIKELTGKILTKWGGKTHCADFPNVNGNDRARTWLPSLRVNKVIVSRCAEFMHCG